MKLEELKGKHEGEEAIVACNGPGLKNIPFSFLESRPLFVLNFFITWASFIEPTYWLSLDPLCFKAAEHVKGKTIRVIKDHNQEQFERECENWSIELDPEKTVYYQMRDEIPGIRWSEKHGTKYSTSAIAAAHLAVHTGVRKVLLVGFDCTYGIGHYEDIHDFQGVSRIPHFYDPRKHFTGYSGMWDDHFGLFAKWAEERGVEVLNLSIPTKSKSLRRGDYRDYWEPQGGYCDG